MEALVHLYLNSFSRLHGSTAHIFIDLVARGETCAWPSDALIVVVVVVYTQQVFEESSVATEASHSFPRRNEIKAERVI